MVELWVVGQANFQSLQHCALLMSQVKELMLQVVVAQHLGEGALALV